MASNFLQAHSPTLFINTCYAYIGICILTFILNAKSKVTANTYHIIAILIIDFIAICLMIYASNKASAGLSYLLLVTMAVGSTFLRGKTSVALAAFTSLLLIGFSLLSPWQGIGSGSSTFTAGITGILLFATAISFRLFSKKIQSDEYKIQQQIEHADYIQRISERIVETIHAGIMIIDEHLNILLINHAAEQLLSNEKPFKEINDIPELNQILNTWKNEPQQSLDSVTLKIGMSHDIKINFTPMVDRYGASLILFIEDERRTIQEAQQLKLASLGRLTASIAHEIRNPLAAISHASQLLDESENMHTSDLELLRMIHMNTERINTTISTILDFSSRKKADIQSVHLDKWLSRFSQNYIINSNRIIRLNIHQKDIYCQVDPNHLDQIISNLVDNGFRHSNLNDAENYVTINTGVHAINHQPFIDIVDEGDGISDENIGNIFEPFYTTKMGGSGLGLYLCKELCQANQAEISYLNKDQENNQKSCFRLLLLKS